MKRKTIGVGIGIAAVVGILVIGFTNIDTIFSRNISETLSEVEVTNPLASLDYKITTKCQVYEVFAYGFVPGHTSKDKELENQRMQQIQQKYNDRLYDYFKEHGLRWYDEPGLEPGPAAMAFLSENRALELLEVMEANPNLLKKLGPLETWGREPFVLTGTDRAEDPECVKRIEQTNLSYKFRFE